jgi:hypothetical protein
MEPFSSGVELAHQITSPLPLGVLDDGRRTGAVVLHAIERVVESPSGFGNHPHFAGAGQRIESLRREFAGYSNCVGGWAFPSGARPPPDHPVTSTAAARNDVAHRLQIFRRDVTLIGLGEDHHGLRVGAFGQIAQRLLPPLDVVAAGLSIRRRRARRACRSDRSWARDCRHCFRCATGMQSQMRARPPRPCSR